MARAAALAAALAAWLVVPAGAACEWPLCTRRCLPCNEKKVGTCRLAMISSAFASCAEDHGPTDCFLGRCLCADGYCAGTDGYHCEPQVCLEGATPPPFEPTGWMVFLSDLGGGTEFPPPDVMFGSWETFAWRSCTASLVLTGFGFIVATTTCGCLCRNTYAKKKAIMARNLLSDVESDEEETKLNPAKQKRPKKPSVGPMLVAALVVFMMTMFGMLVRLVTFQQSASIFDDQFERAFADVRTVASDAETINATCGQFEQNLRDIGSGCKSNQALMSDFSNKGGDAIAEYIDAVSNYVGIIQPIPGQMADIEAMIEAQRAYVAWGPVLPLALVTLFCALMVVEGVLTERFGTSAVARFEDVGLRLAAVLFWIVIMITTVVAGASLAVAIGTSRFCLDVDSNTLEYIADLTEVDLGNYTVYNISRYYIAGDVYNPVLGYIEMAEKYINEIMGLYQDAQAALLMFGSVCPSLDNLDIQGINDEAHLILEKCRGILAAQNIYPYYKELVHRFACGTLIQSASWIVFFQVLVGTIAFPICCVLTHSFLVRWAIWKEDQGETVALDEDSDDSDEEGRPSYSELKRKVEELEAENKALKRQSIAAPQASGLSRAISTGPGSTAGSFVARGATGTLQGRTSTAAVAAAQPVASTA